MSKTTTVCYPCGVTASVLTSLRRYGRPPKKVHFDLSTYHIDECNCCHKTTEVTESRDFFHPDFGLIDEINKYFNSELAKSKCLKCKTKKSTLCHSCHEDISAQLVQDTFSNFNQG